VLNSNISEKTDLAKSVHLEIIKTPFDVRIKERNFSSSSFERIKPNKPNKKEILSFSLRAQKNAKFTIASAARGMTTAVSLTYPEELQPELNFNRINRDRDVFIKALKREYGNNLRYVWMKEFQSNGSPHYHMMIECPKVSIDDQEYFIRNTWYDIVGSGLIKHWYRGIYCDKIRDQKGYANYLAKYLAKMDQKEAPSWFGKVGRFWGGSRNAFEIEKEIRYYQDDMVGVAYARRSLRTFRKWRVSKLKAAGLKYGKKYNIKRQNSGFVAWSGRAAYEQIMDFENKQTEVPW